MSNGMVDTALHRERERERERERVNNNPRHTQIKTSVAN
jgi:transcription initiation factor TFIID subunit TAF12